MVRSRRDMHLFQPERAEQPHPCDRHVVTARFDVTAVLAATPEAEEHNADALPHAWVSRNSPPELIGGITLKNVLKEVYG